MAALHGQAIGHLIKRGVSMMQSGEPALPAISMAMDRDDLMQTQQDSLNKVFLELPTWGIFLIVITIVAFYFLILSLSYTIGRVIMTLAMIETPTVDYIPIATLDNLDDGSKSAPSILIDGEAHIVEKNKPITSKIRTTLRHLTAHAGWTARWRGLGYGIIYTFCNGLVHAMVSGMLFWLPGAQMLAAIAAAVATAPVHCAWTHKMISVQSAKGARARLPGRGVWRQLWIPNVVASASCQASMMIVALVVVVLARGSIDMGNDSQPVRFGDSFVVVMLKVLAVLALAFFLAFFVVLPNYAALTRIEATLLPDDEDTIVPFDRTFGGKVTPVVVGGSGFSYVKEVCSTFDSEARSRIMKLFFKGVAIIFALFIAYIHVIAFEYFIVIAPAAHRAAKHAQAN